MEICISTWREWSTWEEHAETWRWKLLNSNEAVDSVTEINKPHHPPAVLEGVGETRDTPVSNPSLREQTGVYCFIRRVEPCHSNLNGVCALRSRFGISICHHALCSRWRHGWRHQVQLWMTMWMITGTLDEIWTKAWSDSITGSQLWDSSLACLFPCSTHCWSELMNVISQKHLEGISSQTNTWTQGLLLSLSLKPWSSAHRYFWEILTLFIIRDTDLLLINLISCLLVWKMASNSKLVNFQIGSTSNIFSYI